jgi:ketosteroid isomerase-like protein
MRRRRARALPLLVLIAVACGHAPKATGPRYPAAMQPFSWLLGAWQTDGGSETWSFAGDAFFGVVFAGAEHKTGSFEVLILHDVPGGIELEVLPEGQMAATFPLSQADGTHAVFDDPEHAFPKRIIYDGQGDALTTAAEGDADDSRVAVAYRRADEARAPELEQADRAFAADTARRGAAGWTDWFDAEGAMWQGKAGRVAGKDAIFAAMHESLDHPGVRLDWTPRASGLAPAGDLGFTVGDWTFAGPDGKARGAYVTVWRKQADGHWRVLFDTGDPVKP